MNKHVRQPWASHTKSYLRAITKIQLAAITQIIDAALLYPPLGSLIKILIANVCHHYGPRAWLPHPLLSLTLHLLLELNHHAVKPQSCPQLYASHHHTNMSHMLKVPKTVVRSSGQSLQKTISYESFSSTLSSLPSLSSKTYLPNMKVRNKLDCPNPNCNIKGAHTWIPPHPISPRPPNVPEVHLARFHESTHPFPNKNCYGLLTQPPFKIASGQRVYTPLYGTVELVETRLMSSKWVEFQLIEEQEGRWRIAAYILVEREWCNTTWSNTIKHNLLLLCCRL